MNTAVPVLELSGLSKTYGGRKGGVRAVQDVSLTIGAGEVYGFLGPNGAGKSTTIRMLLGLITPTAGRASLWGKDVLKTREGLHRVGSLVDGGTFYPFMSGRKTLQVLSRTHGRAPDARIDRLLDEVGLGRDGDRKVKGYSTGMRQRLGVAAALLNDPDLVILDEPVNGLDAAGIQEMRALIRRLAADQGKTVFLSSHLLHEVQQVCDRVAIITKGRIVREASIADLLHQDDVLSIEAAPEPALAALAGRWPAEVTPTGLRITARHEAVPEIVRTLVAANVDVFGVAAERKNLEDVFLSITQPEAADV